MITLNISHPQSGEFLYKIEVKSVVDMEQVGNGILRSFGLPTLPPITWYNGKGNPVPWIEIIYDSIINPSYPYKPVNTIVPQRNVPVDSNFNLLSMKPNMTELEFGESYNHPEIIFQRIKFCYLIMNKFTVMSKYMQKLSCSANQDVIEIRNKLNSYNISCNPWTRMGVVDNIPPERTFIYFIQHLRGRYWEMVQPHIIETNSILKVEQIHIFIHYEEWCRSKQILIIPDYRQKLIEAWCPKPTDDYFLIQYL